MTSSCSQTLINCSNNSSFQLTPSQVAVRIVSTMTPFTMSQPRMKPPNKNNYPGPGSYNLEQRKQITIKKGNMKILTPSCENNFFKSKTKRFFDSNNSTPGPGQYNTEIKQKKSLQPKRKSNKMIQYFKQQKIRLIPTKWVPIDLKPFNKSKKPDTRSKTAFNSKSSRDVFNSRPETALGPGSYNLYNSLKQSENKVERLKNKVHPSSTIEKYRLNNPLVDSLFHKQSKKQDNSSWIGPGYYYSDKEKLGKVKNPFVGGQFGSSVSRFEERTENEQSKPFVPLYSQLVTSTTLEESRAFKSKQNRFKQIERQTVGPGSYQFKNDFEDLINKNYLRGAHNNFGKAPKRFLQQSQVLPGPGQYNILKQNKEDQQKYSRIKSACSLKNLKQKQKQLYKKYYFRYDKKGLDDKRIEDGTLSLANSKLNIQNTDNVTSLS